MTREPTDIMLTDLYETITIDEIFTTFFNDPSSVNVEDKTGNTPLHYALKGKTRNIAQSMLQHFTNVNACDEDKNTVLHLVVNYACEVKNDSVIIQEYEEMVRILVSKGACIYITNSQGVSPLETAITFQNLALLQIFEKYVSDFSRICRSYYSLHLLCNSKISSNLENCQKIFNFIINQGCDVNVKDIKGRTPILLAAQLGQNNVVEILAKFGVDVNFKDQSRGYAPIHEAALRNDLKMLKILIENKANVHAKTRRAETALHLCSEENVLDLLVKKGCNVNAKDIDGLTPILLATRTEKSNVVKKLIELRANIDCTEPTQGYTPFHEAALRNNSTLLKILKDGGADVNVTSNSGKTALFMCSDKIVVEKLIELGVHVDVTGKDGKLPLHVAILEDNEKLTKDFLRFGADINENVQKLNLYGYESVSETISEHLIKLKVVELFIDKKWEPFLTSDDNSDQIHEKCIIEIEILKSYKINDYITLYDLLHTSRYSSCSYVNNKKLKELIMSPTLEEQFPMYHVFISAAYYMGFERQKLLEPAREALQKLANMCLPELCTHEIFCYLRNASLRCMIKAVDIQTTYQPHPKDPTSSCNKEIFFVGELGQILTLRRIESPFKNAFMFMM